MGEFSFLSPQNPIPLVLLRLSTFTDPKSFADLLAMTNLKIPVLVWMAVQSSLHSLLIHYSRVRTDRTEMFIASVAVFLTELMKAAVCVAMVFVESGGFMPCLRKLKKQILDQPIDTLKDNLRVWIVPTLYMGVNDLFYHAASHLDAATFMVLSQMKIFSTAIFAILLLRYRLSYVQWMSLFVLCTGVCLIQSHPTNAAHANSHVGIVDEGRVQVPWIGFVACLVACAISGFAGVYFESILKCSAPVSIWTRNTQMSMFSVPVSFAAVLIYDGSTVAEKGFLYGFDYVVWLVVFFYCVGGLSVAMCIKYADNISKNFATSSAIVISTIASVLFFDFDPNLYFMIGASCVVASIFLYSCCASPTPNPPCAATVVDDTSDGGEGRASATDEP